MSINYKKKLSKSITTKRRKVTRVPAGKRKKASDRSQEKNNPAQRLVSIGGRCIDNVSTYFQYDLKYKFLD